MQKPIIVQGDGTVLLEVDNPLYSDARDFLGLFAHLDKSPEYMHTYKITNLSLWNAAALGIDPEEIIKRLREYSKFPVSAGIEANIKEIMSRFGKLELRRADEGIYLYSEDPDLLSQLVKHPRLTGLFEGEGEHGFKVSEIMRGKLKQALIDIGYPVRDNAGFTEGEEYKIRLRDKTSDGSDFTIRKYQEDAVFSFLGNPSMPGGNGVIVLPCGAGKTIVGIKAMEMLSRKTLILVTNITAARQWKREIIDKTDINPNIIEEYSGEHKGIGPVTIATYQILTYRRKKSEKFKHFDIFNKEDWGLIIYDEVHLLPAPVFQYTAEIQSRRRLGLTATLVREDGHEKDVFALIGPKKYDVPWKDLENQGWIAKAKCIEIRVDLPVKIKTQMVSEPVRKQLRIAYENPKKADIVQSIVENRHEQDRILIFGQYISQVESLGKKLNIPVITGSTNNEKRDELFNGFRRGEVPVLVLSKVGNFAVDLPDANVAVQVSGAFGSRQEEAQRLGRLLRPEGRDKQALYYSIVTRESKELDFAMKRQLFLAEQGYKYEIRYYQDGNMSDSG